jgi:uncharacterized membrane protein YfcA
MSKILFLRWWLAFVLITVGFLFSYFLGFFQKIYEADSTKLSFLILAIFLSMSVWCGLKTWKWSQLKEPDIAEHRRFRQLEEIGWFASDICLSIGMIGTVIGFIMMLVGFTSVDASNAKSVQELLSTLGAGMSTALYTTLTGLISSVLLKIQYFNLGHSITTAEHEFGLIE